ncbi:MAG: phage major capsid protein [Acutalibacteraceae bacterium]|nr:phage major capsid protein [Acutalibacteraceae bacterium]
MNALTEKRNALYAEAQELVAKAENEGRGFTDEEKADYTAKTAEIRSLDAQLETSKELRELALKSKNEATPDSKEKEAAEVRAFAALLTGKPLETRGVNITYGANGAVIPDTIMSKIIDKVVEISPLFAAATKYSIPGDITIPKIDRSSGDITVAFSAEFSELEANGFSFGSITLSGHLAASLVLISKQLINNGAVDIVGIVIQKMAEKIAVFAENFLLNGDSNIQNSGIAGSYDSTNNKVTVANIAGITGDKLIDVQDKIPDTYQTNAAWYMNSTVRTAVRKLKDGQGNYLLIPDYQRGSGYILLGKPVHVTDNLPTTTTATSGDEIIYYGDFSGLAVKTGERAEIDILREKYATQHAIGINTWFEIDARVENTQKIAALALS